MSPLQKSLAALALVFASVAAIGAGAARDISVIHGFCKRYTCGDGENPQTSLIADPAGNLYGTIYSYPVRNGAVYQLSPEPGRKKWKYKVLHYFCDTPDCIDGSDPSYSTLIMDVAGSLYGTTNAGGAGSNGGVAFKLTPNAGRTHWKATVLVSFCVKNNCADGSQPYGGLTYVGAQTGAPYDGVSPLYGMTSAGGRRFGGVVFSLTPDANGKWSKSVLYAFCSTGGHNCTDGAFPSGQLVTDAVGNLYGGTESGGPNGHGVVFRLSPQLGERSWSETVLHGFCSLANCADGWRTESGLVFDGSGNLFGSAVGNDSVGGVLFKVDSGGAYSVIYDFCSQPNCADGSAPRNLGGLVIDPDGNIFGTTAEGGSQNWGTVFELHAGSFKVLKNFCSGCDTGGVPSGGLLLDAAGNIFGTTGYGGKLGQGVVFKLMP
jgi:uncharacterized repeat protein (TIGR03803 family)